TLSSLCLFSDPHHSVNLPYATLVRSSGRQGSGAYGGSSSAQGHKLSFRHSGSGLATGARRPPPARPRRRRAGGGRRAPVANPEPEWRKLSLWPCADDEPPYAPDPCRPEDRTSVA